MVSLVESSAAASLPTASLSSPRLEYEETPPSSPTRHQFTRQDEQRTNKHEVQERCTPLRRRQVKWFLPLSILSAFFIGYYITVTYIFKRNNHNQDGHFENHYSSHETLQDEELILSCPSNVTKAENDKEEWLNEFYEHENNKFDDRHKNTTDTYSNDTDTIMKPIDVEKLKNTRYDGWNHNYNQFKDILYDWKSERFSSLKPGDRIFEVSCTFDVVLLVLLYHSSHIPIISSQNEINTQHPSFICFPFPLDVEWMW